MADSTPQNTAEIMDNPIASHPGRSLESTPTNTRARPDSHPIPTDSMVTVRLSDDKSSLPKENVLSIDTTVSDAVGPVQSAPLDSSSPTIEPCQSPAASMHSSSLCTPRSRTGSNASDSPTSANGVDWEVLERTEEQQPRDEGTDESTALLLARLEQENNALATNPKANLSSTRPTRSPSRPPSIQHLKRLVNGPKRSSLRYSQIPTLPMTEGDFWAVLISDYSQTLQRLPTLTSNKIRGGIPDILRGLVWSRIAGATDMDLRERYERLATETSPYDGLIGKDIGRSFPNVEMFRDPNGEGQKSLARVLKAFSLYDVKIGYCQGLGFVVGPLLLYMSDADAFCVLVRLMEQYDLRSCFLPDLSGLHLRIYEFQSLLAQHLPVLAAHLNALNIEPLYASQWFLSFFGVTCPIPILVRIYDVLIAEGASETLMRVALSLMQRNQKKILACKEFEDAMSLLLSRSLWDPYTYDADGLVSDFVGLTGLVTRETLQALETTYNEAKSEDVAAKVASLPDLQAAASRFLGRFWAGSHSSSKSVNLSPAANSASRPHSLVRRTPSKQSMASTLGSFESSDTSNSTAPTEMSRRSSGDSHSVRTVETALAPSQDRKTVSKEDKDMHLQIEELLTAMSDLQRERAVLLRELQKEREEREEDQKVANALLYHVKSQEQEMNDILGTDGLTGPSSTTGESDSGSESTLHLIAQAEKRFSAAGSKRTSILQTKHQLRDDMTYWKLQCETESKRYHELSRRLDEQEKENSNVKDELRDARSRLQDGYHERQRLERQIKDLKSRKTNHEPPSPTTDSPATNDRDRSPAGTGLREFRLGRSDTMRAQPNPSYSRRTSSLLTHSVLATENNAPASEDTLLTELVKAKTSEALARQELEEVKGKLDTLRKVIGGASSSPSHRSSPVDNTSSSTTSTSTFGFGTSAGTAATKMSGETPKASTAENKGGGGGGFFSGWGKRSVSNAEGKA